MSLEVNRVPQLANIQESLAKSKKNANTSVGARIKTRVHTTDVTPKSMLNGNKQINFDQNSKNLNTTAGFGGKWQTLTANQQANFHTDENMSGTSTPFTNQNTKPTVNDYHKTRTGSREYYSQLAKKYQQPDRVQAKLHTQTGPRRVNDKVNYRLQTTEMITIH